MKEDTLNENDQKRDTDVKDEDLKKLLSEAFRNGEYMTSDEFCQRLKALKISLMRKHQQRYGNNNSE